MQIFSDSTSFHKSSLVSLHHGPRPRCTASGRHRQPDLLGDLGRLVQRDVDLDTRTELAQVLYR
eukprot:scaffold80744_cov62-Phaeocystis_antarctica.AAC.1